MAIALSIASAFDRFAREGAIVGRLVVEYGELEWALCLVAGAAAQDRGAALRAMYRARDGAQRIAAGDALVRTHLRDPALGAILADTVARLRDCLRIRDRYAQTSWTIEDGVLQFVDIDAALACDDRTGREGPAHRRVTLALLEDQQRLFAAVMQNLTYLHWDLEAINGNGPGVGDHYLVPIAPAAAAA